MVQLNPAAIIALKHALTSIYWYKNDLKSFVTQCLIDRSIVLGINWEGQQKIQSVSDLIDELNKRNDTQNLVALCLAICKINDFRHLEMLEDGARKKQIAENAVEQLRKLVQPHEDDLKAKEIAKQKKKQAEAEKQIFQNAIQELAAIRQEFYNLLSSSNPQNRGYQLEQIMYRLFVLNDLDPKASFKVLGEQVDGAFSLDGTEYLFEAKWQKELINMADLNAFKGKVETKLENTLGLFLSINGFSKEAVEAFQGRDSKLIILMEGSDLMAVLDDRVKLANLINRKKQIAARQGRIFVTYSQMIQEQIS